VLLDVEDMGNEVEGEGVESRYARDECFMRINHQTFILFRKSQETI
jgi:hypothetical protein